MTAMNKMEINNKGKYKQLLNSMEADVIQSGIINNKDLHDVLRFHQKTSWTFPYNWNFTREVQEWLSLVEHTDVVPEVYEKRIPLNVDYEYRDEFKSVKEYDLEWKMGLDDLARILYRSFGRAKGKPSKNYPSAGALYPVIPIVFIFSDEFIPQLEKGSYIFDATNNELLLIKKFNNETLRQVLKNLNLDSKALSNIAMGYAIDIKRSITKYRKRGYRHALIEVGLMAQSLRNSLELERNTLSDLCWSGFNDNALTHLSGLSSRLAPITLIQWFGKR